MKIYIPILFLVLTLLLTGCNHFTSPARQHELDPKESYWLDYDASRRGAFYISDGKSIKTCAEPSPDVANKLTEKLEASVTYGGATGTGKADFGQDVVKLAERTQMIMFLREALFRLCELSLNTNISSNQYVALYKEVLDTSFNITKADANNAKAKRINATANLEKTLKSNIQVDKEGDLLRAFWKPDGKTINKGNEKKIKDWLKQNIDEQVSITFFMRSETFKEKRAQAVQELILSN